MRALTKLAALLLLSVSCAMAQTVYVEAWASSLGPYTYTQTACGATCADVLLATDGNPADAVSNKITGRNKAETGYWSAALTWEAMGVPVGDQVQTVDGQWDDKTVQTAVACTSSTTAGLQLFDSANITEITASSVEPAVDVSGDTASWTTRNASGAVAVNAGYQASGTTVTVRFNVNPASGNNSSAACEVRGDNLKLTIVSTTPSARSRVIVTRLRVAGMPRRRSAGAFQTPFKGGRDALR